MPYGLSLGGRVHDARKLVCVKHEGIPLHYKNITKHEKARTGVIVQLSSLRRGEQYRYINLVKKVGGLPEKFQRYFSPQRPNYYHSIYYHFQDYYQYHY